MKIFIRDTGETEEGKSRRGKILTGIQALIGDGRVVLEQDEKEGSVELFLYHTSDTQANETEYAYIEQVVAADPGKLLVLYSGSVRHPSVPVEPSRPNVWKVPPQHVINHLAKVVEFYLENGRFEADILLGSDPSYVACINLLNKFLPLDVELQLGSVEKCREAAHALAEEGQQREVAELFGLITNRRVEFVNGELPESGGAGAAAGDALESLRRLMQLVRACAGVNGNDGGGDAKQLYEVFGYQFNGEGRRRLDSQSRPVLAETGFHRTYERLRNKLLAVVEQKGST